MAVVQQSNMLGLAYYDSECATIHMMPDVPENDDLSLLHKVIHVVQPSFIVASARQHKMIFKLISPDSSDSTDNKNSSDSPDNITEDAIDDEWKATDCKVEALPSADFNYEVGKERILNTDLIGIPSNLSHVEINVYFSNIIPFDNFNMVRAIGGLLKYINRKRIGVELKPANVLAPVTAFKIFVMKDIVYIDYDTYRQWLKKPIQNFDELNMRLNVVQFFTEPQNSETARNLQDSVKNVKNITARTIARIGASRCSLPEWKTLYKSTFYMTYIGDLCRTLPQDIPLFNRISVAFTEDLRYIASLIVDVMDLEESMMEGKFVVKCNVDPSLDEKKRTYLGLPGFLTRVAVEEIEYLDNRFTSCRLIYLPQIGFLLSIPRLPDMEINNFAMEGLDFMFATQHQVHYRTRRTRELDAVLGDVKCDIHDHEFEIMMKIYFEVEPRTGILYQALNLVAELDCLLALAAAACEYGYIRPCFTLEPVIRIKGGRHPLAELCVDMFVPNDFLSTYDGTKVKVVTGPNASGKSIYLKQVGLIVFMAFIGSFVPAEEVELGPINGIYSRIHSCESMSLGLSTFAIELKQITSCLTESTENSLVLVDEFGKGTKEELGLALLTSIMHFWLEQGTHCPHLILCTHYHDLIKERMLPNSNMLHYQTFDMVMENNEPVYLYKLMDGFTSFSYALHVAKKANCNMQVVERASQLFEMYKCDTDMLVHWNDEIPDEEVKRCESIIENFLELDLESDSDNTAVVAFLDKCSEEDCTDMPSLHTPLPGQAFNPIYPSNSS
uniref:mutS protein homolog 5 n=1 Tax=Myxine glutinosa TaxID=7769 RepID=UPI00358FF9D3